MNKELKNIFSRTDKRLVKKINLFRGKRVDGNRWVYGYLYTTSKSNPMESRTAWIFFESDKYKVNVDTVGQFTNKYSVNGKEIYEDDILQYNNTHPVIVKWNNEFSKYDTKDNTGEWALSVECWNEARLIGNLYDNPEYGFKMDA
jgi:hypothetical protein